MVHHIHWRENISDRGPAGSPGSPVVQFSCKVYLTFCKISVSIATINITIWKTSLVENLLAGKPGLSGISRIDFILPAWGESTGMEDPALVGTRQPPQPPRRFRHESSARIGFPYDTGAIGAPLT